MFGSVLRQLREERHLTQRELGKVLGISESTVGMYERGKREPDLETLKDIADFFDVDADYLTGRSSYRRAALRKGDGPLKLAEIISRFCRDNKLSPQQFADRCGLEAELVSIFEKGRNPLSGRPVAPSKDTIKKLCAGMGISVHDLFSIMDVQDWIESGFDVEQDPADRELLDILDELRSREDMRMLFKLARGASPDDVRRAAAIIEALRKQD